MRRSVKTTLAEVEKHGGYDWADTARRWKGKEDEQSNPEHVEYGKFVRTYLEGREAFRDFLERERVKVLEDGCVIGLTKPRKGVMYSRDSCPFTEEEWEKFTAQVAP